MLLNAADELAIEGRGRLGAGGFVAVGLTESADELDAELTAIEPRAGAEELPGRGGVPGGVDGAELDELLRLACKRGGAQTLS